MEKCTHHNCKHSTSLSQTLEEMDFERGPWSAEFLSNLALEGDLGRLIKLLQKVDVDVTDTSGYCALHYASRAGHLNVVKYLVEHGANVNLLTRGNQSSPLHRACQQGHTAIVAFLLRNGAEAGFQDSDGSTPLHRAASANHAAICKLLVTHNPHLVHILDSRGRTPKDCCSDVTLQKVLDS